MTCFPLVSLSILADTDSLCGNMQREREREAKKMDSRIRRCEIQSYLYRYHHNYYLGSYGRRIGIMEKEQKIINLEN
jgi:hypothetical protein